MVVVRYIDVYTTYYEDDEHREELVIQNHTIPYDINPHDIIGIGPYMSTSGKLFKNVSIIEDRYGKAHKVVGNYKDIRNRMDNTVRNKIGYGKDTN